MKLALEFIGLDSWDRPVYIDENEKLWKDVDPRKDRTPDLCTVQGNTFGGEPSMNLCYFENYQDIEVVFLTGRVTWDF